MPVHASVDVLDELLKVNAQLQPDLPNRVQYAGGFGTLKAMVFGVTARIAGDGLAVGDGLAAGDGVAVYVGLDTGDGVAVGDGEIVDDGVVIDDGVAVGDGPVIVT